MKKNFALKAAKQLLNNPVVSFASKNEQNDHLRLTGKDKEQICCEWMPQFTVTISGLQTA
ncbi:hypothetical protein [Tellurirhabdus bombi]|jgi:uncharacterized pyridoxamine 5'-phosphate oxidase family protein|uniref:hypothetical protein n=1 Tax=Tellurirhabdus bombi TaxID=2907205 RepID=UPI001F2AF9A4|nr:hypothetical protein [Tellurirhabdus bombi]